VYVRRSRRSLFGTDRCSGDVRAVRGTLLWAPLGPTVRRACEGPTAARSADAKP
jgi:hypothetical protein